MGKVPTFVGDHTDRHGHQWYTMQLAPAILAEKISRPPILLRVLIRNQHVEHRHDLAAALVHRRCGDDENEIISADVADESILVANAFDDVMENLRENANDAITLVIRIAVVEFLEMIEVGIAGREAQTALEARCCWAVSAARSCAALARAGCTPASGHGVSAANDVLLRSVAAARDLAHATTGSGDGARQLGRAADRDSVTSLIC